MMIEEVINHIQNWGFKAFDKHETRYYELEIGKDNVEIELHKNEREKEWWLFGCKIHFLTQYYNQPTYINHWEVDNVEFQDMLKRFVIWANS